MSRPPRSASPVLGESDSVIGGVGLERRLLRSHGVVALIGVAMLLVSLGVILNLRSNALRLANVRSPTAQASTGSLSGVERSLAGLRGWVVSDDPMFREDRAAAWNDEIWPTINRLNRLSRDWTRPENLHRLNELKVVLADLSEIQWWIEDVAQTPGNEPARVLLLQNLTPVIDDLFQATTAMIELEKEIHGGARRKYLLATMADLRSAIRHSAARINRYVESASLADKELFFNDLEQTRELILELTEADVLLTEEQSDHLEQIRKELRAYEVFSQEVMEARESEQWNVAQFLLADEAVPLARQARHLLLAMSSSQTEMMLADARRVTTISNTSVAISIALVAITILVAWFVSHFSATRITRPIQALSRATADLAAGRLTEDIAVISDDELGQLTRSFNAMRDSLKLAERAQTLDEQNRELDAKNQQIEEQHREISERTRRLELALEETRRTAAELDKATAQMGEVTTLQVAGAQEQGAAITQTATSIEEVATMALSTAERAQNVGQTSRRAVEIGQQGRQAVQDSAAAMNSVKGHVKDIADRIHRVADQAMSIAQIVSAVDEIADQTNLLALNAAIEAAHAGEQGKGFDIVAKEVKALAEQSKQATEQVRGFLNDVSQAISEATLSAEVGSRDAATASDVVAKAGETINALESALDESAQAAEHITTAAAHQAEGMAQIRKAITDIDDVTRQNTLAAQRMRQTAQSLGSLGEQLKQSLVTGAAIKEHV